GFPPARSPGEVCQLGIVLRRAKAGRKRSCPNMQTSDGSDSTKLNQTLAAFMLHSVMRANHARSRTITITYPSFSTTFGESKPRALGHPLWLRCLRSSGRTDPR